MKKNILKRIAVTVLICVLCITSGGQVYAAEMEKFPLQMSGSYSQNYTRAIQVMLINYNSQTRNEIIRTGGADGIYGSATVSAVKKFQAMNGLNADGKCGANTWTKLKTTLLTPYSNNGYLMYNGMFPYYATKYNMRRHLGTSVWECYYGTWHKVA